MADATWMVRAGEGGYLVDVFAKGLVAVGWSEIGNLTAATSREAIRDLYAAAYPEHSPGKATNAIAVLYKFRCVLANSTRVITYDPTAREYLVGSISSDYRFDPTIIPECPHVRSVDWSARVDRDRLSPSARNSLGSTLTLFAVNDDVLSELLSSPEDQPALPDDVITEDKAGFDQIKEDTQGKAHELIKDKILKLSDEDLEQLTAAILRAMGYRSRVTPKGPDRGVDVIASPDGLGLEEPRIKAEVKHRAKTPMGSQEVRSFLGGLRSGDRALYVSTGGFTKDARYEADRSNIPITLLDLGELATLVATHYERFDTEGRVLLPLTKVYLPAE